MSKRKMAAVAAWVAAALYAIAVVVGGTAPEPDTDLDAVVLHYTDHRSGILLAGALLTLAVALIFVFLGQLREAMDDAEEGASLLSTPTVVAWVLLFAILLLGGLPLGAITWRGAAETSPDLVQFAFDMNSVALYAGSAVFAAVSILGPVIVAWRTGMLPRWLIALGLLEVGVNLVELTGATTRTGLNASGYAAGVGPPLWLAWVVAAGIVLYRTPAPPDPA